MHGCILTFEQFKQIYGINGLFRLHGYIRSLPKKWLSSPDKRRAEYPVIHQQIELVLSKERGANHLYRLILANKTKAVKNSWEQRWVSQFGEINWTEIYTSKYHNKSVYYHILTRAMMGSGRLHVLMGGQRAPPPFLRNQ